MIEKLLVWIGYFLSKNKHFGNIRSKDETFAPQEWKESLWEKLKKDKLFHPIDLNNKEHFKEIKIKIGKKFIIIAINIFLISFLVNLAKDTYNIARAEYLILNVQSVDFSKDLPISFLELEQNKTKELSYSVKKKDILRIAKTTTELSLISKIKESLIVDRKKKYINENVSFIKGNIFSFLNNLFVLYLIYKKKITRQQ